MGSFIIALRNSFRLKGNNVIKVLSLAAGLTVGLVLIAKIVFELSYNKFYPDSDRVYQVYTNYGVDDDELDYSFHTSGGVAKGMKNEISKVENATRITDVANRISVDNKEPISAEVYLADENFFDVLQRPILVGNAKEILSTPMQCLVSKSIAKKIGADDVVGKTIRLGTNPSGHNEVTVAGIFEDIPENTYLKYDVVVSLNSISNFLSYDGTDNWEGNEMYLSFVKLASGVEPESIAEEVVAMQERHQDMEALEKAGMRIRYFFVGITGIQAGDTTMRLLILVFAVLATIVLATSILNYTLIVVSSLVKRTKEIAVHKCYGASGINISKLMFLETFIHLIIALALSSTAIYLFKNTIEKLLSTSFQALFAPQIILILILVCAIIFIVSGFVPSYLFSKIPVAAAFKRAKESHRRWKTILVFIEVAATSFLLTLLLIIGLQYSKLIRDDQGYSFQNLLYVTDNVGGEQIRNSIEQELRNLPDVKNVSQCTNLPSMSPSGNYITEIGDDRELFNSGDLYYVDENFLSTMEIPIIEGRGFVKGESGHRNMMVSESFVDALVETTGWTDGVVGKSVWVSEHGVQTIVGVFGNIKYASDGFGRDMRPAFITYDYDGTKARTFAIKMNKLSSGTIASVMSVFEQFAPERFVRIRIYEDEFKENFYTIRTFRSGVLVCGLVTLIIAIIGLIGYLSDETNRRRSEIAIRKINGATIKDVQNLFISNILKVTGVAVLLGIVAAAIAAKFLQSNFIDKANISIFIYILCGVCIISIILSVVSLSSYKASTRNPMDNLAKE